MAQMQALPWLRIPMRDLLGWVSTSDPEAIAASLLLHGAILAAVAISVSALGSLSRELVTLLSTARSLTSRWSSASQRLRNRIAIGTITLSSLAPLPTAAQEHPLRPAVSEPLDRFVSPGFVPFAATTAPRSAVPTSVRVEPGDTLWTIAASHLERALRREPSAVQITRHWRDVIDLNLEGLRSGDPDLIHPGEQILLPRVEI